MLAIRRENEDTSSPSRSVRREGRELQHLATNKGMDMSRVKSDLFLAVFVYHIQTHTHKHEPTNKGQ